MLSFSSDQHGQMTLHQKYWTWNLNHQMNQYKLYRPPTVSPRPSTRPALGFVFEVMNVGDWYIIENLKGCHWLTRNFMLLKDFVHNSDPKCMISVTASLLIRHQDYRNPRAPISRCRDNREASHSWHVRYYVMIVGLKHSASRTVLNFSWSRSGVRHDPSPWIMMISDEHGWCCLPGAHIFQWEGGMWALRRFSGTEHFRRFVCGSRQVWFFVGRWGLSPRDSW